jgi:hypothetical protein
VFLVHDNKSQSLEWQEYGRTSSKNYIIRVLGKLFLPYLHTLCITVFGVIDTQPFSEHPL